MTGRELVMKPGEGDGGGSVSNGLGCRVSFCLPSNGLTKNRKTHRWSPGIAF